MARKRLGELLLEAGLIDEPTLRVALTEQRRYGGHLGRVLVDMKKVLEEDLVAALSRQLAVPVIDLDRLEIPQAVVDLVPGDMAENYGIIPFAQPMKFLDVAMGDPTNQTAIDELRVRTQLNIRTYLAGPKAVERALLRYYGRGLMQGGRRVRSELELDSSSADGDMELVGGYDLGLAANPPPRPAVRAGAAGSSPAVARLPVPTRESTPTPAPPVAAAAAVASPVSAVAAPAVARTPTPAVARTPTPAVTRAPTPSRVLSSPSITPPPVAAADGAPGTSPPGARVPTMAEIAALHERIANLEALLRRDEDVLKKLMALLIEKGVATRDEIIARLK